MAISSISIPDKDKESREKYDKASEYCKRHHLNRSAIMVDLFLQWAEEKGVFDENKGQ